MPKTTGAGVIAEMLRGYGVSHLFMVPAVLRTTMAELELRTSIARIHTHGEKAAAYMADGYARASGKVGVCMAQIVGALNLAAGLRDAYLAQTPILAFTGGRTPETKFRKVYQEVDDLPAFLPVTKWNATVDAVQRIPEMLRQAFRVATTGAPGPVHLQFRGNEAQLDAEEGELDAYCEPQFGCVPPFRPQCNSEELRLFLDVINRAERPVIVAGGGVRNSGAAPELRALAETLGIPVATSLNGKDVIPGNHPLTIGVVGTYSREAANRIVGEADLVCFVGTEAGGMTTHVWQVPPIGTPAVQIDINPTVLGHHYPLRAALCGDAKAVLAGLLEQATPASAERRRPWITHVQRTCRAWYDKFDVQLRSDAVPIHPARLCWELSANVPEDAVIVVDTGHAGMWMGGMFDLRSAQQAYIRSAGHLGWAFPAGLGAKCARPDSPVVVFTGDAGFWYHIAELETAVRWKINTVVVVNNNSGGNQSKRGFDRIYGGEQTAKARELWTFTHVDFAQVARQIGAVGERVTDPSQFSDTLRRALAAGKPAVVDVVTDIEALAPLAVI